MLDFLIVALCYVLFLLWILSVIVFVVLAMVLVEQDKIATAKKKEAQWNE